MSLSTRGKVDVNSLIDNSSDNDTSVDVNSLIDNGSVKKKVGGGESKDGQGLRLASNPQSQLKGSNYDATKSVPSFGKDKNTTEKVANNYDATKSVSSFNVKPPIKPSIDNNFGMKNHDELAIDNLPSKDAVSNPSAKSMQQRADNNEAQIEQNNVNTEKVKPITENVLNPSISTVLAPKNEVEKPDFDAASFLKEDISLPHINPVSNTMLDYSKVDPNDIVADKNSLAYYGKLRKDAIDNQISFLESDKEGAGKGFNKEKIDELKAYKNKLQQSVDYFAQIHGGLDGKDATDAGVIRAKINGDPTAYQYDRLKKEHGTVNDAASFNFENQGLQSQQTALDAQYAGKEKDDNYYKQSADILKQKETIWDRHPKELIRQWGGVIANYAASKLPAWKKLSGLWIKDVPEYISEMRKEGYDIPQSVSQNITDEDVPMNMSIPAQTWYGAASHVENMIGGIKRLGGEALGMDEDAITQSIQNSRDYLDKRYGTPTNEQLYQPSEKIDLRKGSPTYMMSIPNPDAGRINPTGTAIVDEVFKGLGGFGAFMGTLGVGGKIAEGVLGKALPEIAGTADATKLAHDYSLAANVVLSSYEGNYQQAGKIIGDNPADEEKRSVLAMTNSLIDYLVFKAIPTQKYASALMDGKQQVSAELGEALKNLPSDLKGLTESTIEKPIKDRLLKPIANALEETGKFGGAQQAGIIAHKIAQTVVSGGNDESSKDWNNIGKESKDMWASLPISMLPGILGGEFLSSGSTSNLRKQGNFYAFANREQSIADIHKAQDEGLLTQDQANKRIQVINTGAKIIDQIPEISPLTGRRFTLPEAAEWTNNRIKEVALEAQKEKVTDDNVLAENYEKRIKALQDVRQSILEGKFQTEPLENKNDEDVVNKAREQKQLGVYGSLGNDEVLKEIAKQAQNIQQDGTKSDLIPDKQAYEQTIRGFGSNKELVDAAISKYPESELLHKPESGAGNFVSGDDLKGKKIYTDFNSTIADKDNNLLPFGEEIKQRINNGEPITIVTKSEDKEGQPEGSNKKRMLDALGLKEQPDNLKIIEGVTPEEKADLAKDGVLIDNSNSVKEASEKSGSEFVNANKYNNKEPEAKPTRPSTTESNPSIKNNEDEKIEGKNINQEPTSDNEGIGKTSEVEGNSALKDLGVKVGDFVEDDKGNKYRVKKLYRSKWTPKVQSYELESKDGKIKYEGLTPSYKISDSFGKVESEEKLNESGKTLKSVLDKHEEDEKGTDMDLVKSIEEHIDETPNNKLRKAIDDYWNAVRESREQYGDRMGVSDDAFDTFQKVLNEEIRKESKHETNETKPTAVTKEDIQPESKTEPKPEIKQGKYEAKARKIVEDLGKKADNLPSWLINKDPNIKGSGLDNNALFKMLGDATIEVGKLMDTGVEFADAIKRGADKLIDDYKKGLNLNQKVNPKLKPDFEQQLRQGFEQHYKENFGEPEKIKTEDNSGQKPPPETPNKESEQTGEEGNVTVIRKSKLIEIEKVKKYYEDRNIKGWSETMRSGLEKLQKEFPDKGLYDAAIEKLNNVRSSSTGQDYGDLTRYEAAAIFHYLLHTVGGKRDALAKNVQSDRNMALASLVYDESLKAIYDDAAVEISKLKTEAAQTLNYSKSGLFDTVNGLGIRRMELLRASGGTKLSDADMKWTEEQWNKEKELIEKAAEARENSLREDFDKKIEQLNKEFEDKLKGKSKTKTLSDKDKAEKIIKKNKEIKDNEADIIFESAKRDMVAARVAKDVSEGKTTDESVDAIGKEGLIKPENIGKAKKYFRDLVREKHLAETDEALEKIKNYAKENDLQDIDKGMVSKNLIKDFVESHIGKVEPKDILNESLNKLKEVLPDVDEIKLRQAFLKKDDYKPDTKDDLQKGISKEKSELKNIAKLQDDISNLNELKDIKKKTFDTDKERSDYENKLIEERDSKLKKLKEERRKISRDERDAQKRKDKLMELDANIKRAKSGQDIIKIHRNKSERDIDDEIEQKEYELKKAIGQNMPAEKLQNKLLEQTKKNKLNKIKELQKKYDNGEFEDAEPKILNKYDSELLNIDKDLKKMQSKFNDKRDKLRKENRSNIVLASEFARSAYMAYLLYRPLTLAKVAASAFIRPQIETFTRLLPGRLFDKMFNGIGTAALAGGESSYWKDNMQGMGAYFRQRGARSLQQASERVEASFQAANNRYNDYKNSFNPNEDVLKRLKEDRDEKMISTIGILGYQFIGGSSAKDFLQALIHRSNEIEQQFGKVWTEGAQGKKAIGQQDSFGTIFKKIGSQAIEGGVELFSPSRYDNKSGKFRQVAVKTLDDADYILGFIGRSHSALKTLSGRYSFMAGFMARVRGAVQREIQLTPDKVLELAHESYLDWERGKYQNPNAISDWWNRMVNNLDRTGSGADRFASSLTGRQNHYFERIGKVAKAAAGIEVAIQRVPVNILWEEISQYAFGLVKNAGLVPFSKRRLASIPKVYREAREQLKEEGVFVNDPEFKQALKDKLSQLDPYQAALIKACFRKGVVGAGVYATALILGGIHYGIFPHMGQKKKKPDEDLKGGELNPGQIMVGDERWNETFSALVSHTQFLWPTFMGLGMAQAYSDQIKSGKSTPESMAKAAYTHLSIISGSVPQFAPLDYIKEHTIDPLVNREIKQHLGAKHQGFTKADESSSTFRYFWDKGVEFTPFNPSKINIPFKDKRGNSMGEKLSEMPKEKWDEYITQYKATLKRELDNLKRNIYYVTIDGEIHSKIPDRGDYKKKRLSELTVSQLKKVIVPAEAKATKAAKEKLANE